MELTRGDARGIEAERRTLQPYAFDVKHVAWWSIYEIGKRICPHFDDVATEQGEDRARHVFIAGDACHTHSPKAGQGMNVPMQDAFNLGWKLAAALRGLSPDTILKTYSAERKAIAQTLIDFDREWAAMLSAPLKDPDVPDSEGVNPEAIQSYFVQHGRYTAGTATQYATGPGTHQHLATGFPIGKRFHSEPVVRQADALPMHLGHAFVADGHWRIFACAGQGDPCATDSAIWKLCDFLASDAASPKRRFTPKGSDSDALIDLRAVFQQPHHDLAVEATHPLLMPRRGQFALQDREKMFCADHPEGDIFDLRGIDRAQGCMVIVRPDQYVAHILPLDAHGELSAFFAAFMLDQS